MLWVAWKKRLRRYSVAMNMRLEEPIDTRGGDNPHPNDVDRKRIERALAQRQRYRYVSPQVRKEACGYRIESPCCSRNVDRNGGVIDIARLEYLEWSAWRLYHKDDRHAEWVAEGEYTTLTAVLRRLNEDPERLFWR